MRKQYRRVNCVLEGREWRKVEGASPEAILQLKAIASVTLPESYIALPSFSNGGEGPLPVLPLWLQLYPIEEVTQIEQTGHLPRVFPEAIRDRRERRRGSCSARSSWDGALSVSRVRYDQHRSFGQRPNDRDIVRRGAGVGRSRRAIDHLAV